ncbi:MAG: prolipoprotein diacylglyceryl transferase [Clostridiales bacterium]|nr:prolipoprotein diacylglyceryl transferase [Clostridiales bacterium]
MNWYGFLIALGIVLCVVLAYFSARKRGIESDIIVDIIIIGLPFAIVFARLYYVIFDLIDPNGQKWTFTKLIGIDDHGLQGLAIYGALIGVAIALLILSYILNRKKRIDKLLVEYPSSKPENHKISYLQLLDLTFTFVMLGQALGRWGNFANKEAHGYAITNQALKWFPMGVEINGTWYYATFFYEFLWDIVGFGLMFFLYFGKFKSFDGFGISTYCIFYGIGRVWIEGMREDSLWLVPPKNVATGAGGVRVSQLLSIILILFGVAFIIAHIVRARRADKKIFIFVPKEKLSDEYFGYATSKLANPMPGIKTKTGDDYIIDKNGVAIRTTGDSASDEKVDENTVNDEKHTDDKEKKIAVEEVYEDKWDD